MGGTDDSEFAERLDRYRSFLYRAAWALTGNRALAQDLVQETLLVAWKARRQLRNQEALQAWLFRILRREAIRMWHKREPWVGWDDDLCNGVPDLSDPEERIELLEALQALSAAHREILVLFYLSDMTYEDLALALDIPIGTVMSRLSRARNALRESLGEEYASQKQTRARCV